MSAEIRNYCLGISEPEELAHDVTLSRKLYDADWDNWVLDEEDISRLIDYIRLEIAEGSRPIVAVFLPNRRFRPKAE